MRAESVESKRYSAVAIILHWLITAFIVVNLIIGWIHDDIPRDIRRDVMAVHMSIGLTVLMLSVLRVLWRLINRPPPLASSLAPWERGLAHLVHFALYAFMFLMPLSGWIMQSTRAPARPILFWGLQFPQFPLPEIDPASLKLLHNNAGWAHELLGYGFAALIVLHVAGALKHQFIDRHPELQRMLPFLR